jgi:UDP-N-acetylmuramate dehydrogenase
MIPMPSNMKENVLGSTLTTMRVGGVVRYHARASSSYQLQECLAYANQQGIPYAAYGAGSNLLLADEGYGGLLIQMGGGSIRILGRYEADAYGAQAKNVQSGKNSAARYANEDKEGMLKLAALAEREEEGETIVVEMSAGIPWGQAVAFSLKESLEGLQWYARIPCTVGGATYNNIHAEQHLLSEVVCAVRSLDPETGREELWLAEELEFGYDTSRFHATPGIITSVFFALKKVGPVRAKENQDLYLGWTAQKAIVQPSGPSAGSVFKNITHGQARSIGQEAVAAGWYIDKAGLKGRSIGGMHVYGGHANFIVNTGAGTQKDFISLVGIIRQSVFEAYGIVLEPEIECWDLYGKAHIWPPTTSR